MFEAMHPRLAHTRFRRSHFFVAHALYTACVLVVVYAAITMSGRLFASEIVQFNIVDESNGWPVPLVELSTTHNVHFVSDNAGVIAFDLPELMNTPTWFTIEGHGYGVPKDGFGIAGVRVTPEPGKPVTIKVKRELPGKRLGRITGAGLFGESQKLGLARDWREQGVLGCDSVQTAQYGGRLFWGWGDTTLAKYPLGLFHMTGATTPLKPMESFKPPVRLRYDYFRDDQGAVRNVARMPGGGPTWLGGYIALPSADGERFAATYAKIEPPLTTYEVGLCVWNDGLAKFEKLKTVWERSRDDKSPPTTPNGHPVIWKDESGNEWALFGDPFPNVRCRASFESWSNPDEWEVLEPQKSVIARTGRKITPHRGSIAWNEFRGKWITIFCELNGENSQLGELWYAEADSPLGEWGQAVKVVTHSDYTFYNPHLHPEFVPKESPVVLFEATYTKAFSGAKRATPRHDYNQVLYRLDLDELFGDPATE